MADFRYRGFEVFDDWPTAAKLKGATKPSGERWFTHYPDGRLIWANTQKEMRGRINEALS